MARDGVAVDAVLAAAVARYVAGEPVVVAVVCRELGVSRQTFYKYVARFRALGVDGFFPQSRRPGRSPSVMAVAVEDAVVVVRKRLAEAGADVGATSIRWWLIDHPQAWPSAQYPVPSRASINRALARRGLLTVTPQRRPRRSSRRFARPARNDLWQMDGVQVSLSGGRVAIVIEALDDHSRLNLACHGAVSENSQASWETFTAAAAGYGLPRQLLTDNGTAFNGHRRGVTTQLEAAAAALGVDTISASVAHPQTCGKSERAHATLLRWLAQQPLPATIEELNDLLAHYRTFYNHRRHQSLDGLTPAQAWRIAPVSGPTGARQHLHVTTPLVSSAGLLAVNGTNIGIGRRHRSQQATVFRTGNNATIFIDGQLIRELTIDPNRPYQPQR